VNFAVKAYDDQHTIGEGTHQRFIVTVATFTEKMKAKADKRGQLTYGAVGGRWQRPACDHLAPPRKIQSGGEFALKA
jgi:hypothetical protein